jgi:hypothetical protein
MTVLPTNDLQPVQTNQVHADHGLHGFSGEGVCRDMAAAKLEHVPVIVSQNPDAAVLPRLRVFWDVTLCHWVNVSQHFEVT